MGYIDRFLHDNGNNKQLDEVASKHDVVHFYNKIFFYKLYLEVLKLILLQQWFNTCYRKKSILT